MNNKIYLENNIFIIKNFINILMLKKINKYLKTSKWTTLDESPYRNLIWDNNQHLIKDDKILKYLLFKTKKLFPDRKKTDPNVISRFKNKSHMGPHVDNPGDNNLEFGCVIYLNDNYDGGEIVFTDLNISIKPTAGLLLIYLPYHPHKVNMVYNNDRYCIGHEFLLKNNERYSYGLDFNIKKKELYGKTIE